MTHITSTTSLPGAAKSEPLMNFEAAYEGTDNDPELLQMLINLFLKKTPEALEKIHVAIAQGDAEALSLQAHSLKGALRTLVVPKLVEAAQELETRGREKRMEGAEALLAGLRGLVDQFYPELHEHLKRLESMPG